MTNRSKNHHSNSSIRHLFSSDAKKLVGFVNKESKVLTKDVNVALKGVGNVGNSLEKALSSPIILIGGAALVAFVVLRR